MAAATRGRPNPAFARLISVKRFVASVLADAGSARRRRLRGLHAPRDRSSRASDATGLLVGRLTQMRAFLVDRLDLVTTALRLDGSDVVAKLRVTFLYDLLRDALLF